jgi:hypothetical protein
LLVLLGLDTVSIPVFFIQQKPDHAAAWDCDSTKCLLVGGSVINSCGT